jgi:hypothetical protein
MDFLIINIIIIIIYYYLKIIFLAYLPRYWNWVCNNKLGENSLVYLEGALPSGVSCFGLELRNFTQDLPKAPHEPTNL